MSGIGGEKRELIELEREHSRVGGGGEVGCPLWGELVLGKRGRCDHRGRTKMSNLIRPRGRCLPSANQKKGKRGGQLLRRVRDMYKNGVGEKELG